MLVDFTWRYWIANAASVLFYLRTKMCLTLDILWMSGFGTEEETMWGVTNVRYCYGSYVVRLVASPNLSAELKPLVTRFRHFYSFIFFWNPWCCHLNSVSAQCSCLTASIASLALYALSCLEVYWRGDRMAAAHWDQHDNRTDILWRHFINNCINNILL